MKRLKFIMSAGCLALFTCIASASPSAPVTLPLPAMPSDLKDVKERADYLAFHFWDNLNMSDTLMSHAKTLLEQSFVDFLSVLPHTSGENVIENSFASLIDRTSADEETLSQIRDLADIYLFNSDSPMRSERQYVSYLKALLDHGKLSEVDRARTLDKLEMISKNLPGDEATDFSFVTLNGEHSTLYDSLPEEGCRLMIIFFDPECEACEEKLGQMQNDPQIEEDIRNGSLKILAVYSGERESAWRRKAASLPSSWTVGYNGMEIEEEDLYFFPSMPTIYIIDHKGIVVERN